MTEERLRSFMYLTVPQEYTTNPRHSASHLDNSISMAIYSSVYIQGGVNHCTFVHKMINQGSALLIRAVAAGGAEGARAPSQHFCISLT